MAGAGDVVVVTDTSVVEAGLIVVPELFDVEHAAKGTHKLASRIDFRIGKDGAKRPQRMKIWWRELRSVGKSGPIRCSAQMETVPFNNRPRARVTRCVLDFCTSSLNDARPQILVAYSVSFGGWLSKRASKSVATRKTAGEAVASFQRSGFCRSAFRSRTWHGVEVRFGDSLSAGNSAAELAKHAEVRRRALA